MDRHTSLYLDIFRPLAALAVVLSHVSEPGIASGIWSSLSGIGVQAVDAFFVLSGFVIAHVASTSETNIKSYAISRCARLYSVAIPAIAVGFLIDMTGRHLLQAPVFSDLYQGYSIGPLMRSLFFINEQWNVHRFPGSNSPYWSLGFEAWYYLLFGVAYYIKGPLKWVGLIALAVFIGPKVMIMMPCWLLGVAAYHLQKRFKIPVLVGLPIFIFSIGVIVAYQYLPKSTLQPFMPFTFDNERLSSTLQDYSLSLLFALNIVGASVVAPLLSDLLDRYSKQIKSVAATTFSIYLMHMPAMKLAASLSPVAETSFFRLPFVIATTIAFCVAFSVVFENQKSKWRKLFEYLADIIPIPVRRSTTGTCKARQPRQ
jgi:peptidoglycan/LPS O-acetylase OafA/YrhL